MDLRFTLSGYMIHDPAVEAAVRTLREYERLATAPGYPPFDPPMSGSLFLSWCTQAGRVLAVDTTTEARRIGQTMGFPRNMAAWAPEQVAAVHAELTKGKPSFAHMSRRRKQEAKP